MKEINKSKIVGHLVIRSIPDTKKVKKPVIYGIRPFGGGDIVYVGKTVNLYKRFISYQHHHHNPLLKKWAKKNKWEMLVIEHDPEDIDASERYWIKKLKKNLFNMTDGGEDNWISRERMPWMGGRGIKCPSELLMFYLKNRKNCDYKTIHSKISKARSKMTVRQRCHFEVSLCMENYHIMTDKFEKWLVQTESRLIEGLDS